MANNITVLDSTSATKTMKTTDTASVHTPHQNIDTIAAGTNLIGLVVAKLGTDLLYDGTTSVTPKFKSVSASSSGNNTLQTAVASKKIRVLSYTLVSAGTCTATFQDGAGGTGLTGAIPLVANSGVSVAFSPVGHFETTANTLLNLSLSAAVAVTGHFAYVEI